MGEVLKPSVRQGCLVSPRWQVFDVQAAPTVPDATWQEIGTVTNFVGVIPFYDPEAGQHPMRFYRARRQSP